MTSHLTVERFGADGTGGRFFAGRLSNGHHGVFDAAAAVVVVRDATEQLAELVASYLNQPGAENDVEARLIAYAVRTHLPQNNTCC